MELRDGKTVTVERFYFSASARDLQEQLLAIRDSVGR
jgi:hypothetical protein